MQADRQASARQHLQQLPWLLIERTCSTCGGLPTPLVLLLHITLLNESCSCSSPKGLSSRRTGRLTGADTGVDHKTCRAGDWGWIRALLPPDVQ
jgi:hypothetical protein